ncbi:hypothetical protein PYW08_005853 [Mythimna loreyi]|uniref:Uncharacterized protein n=1 Tax=Mythimna loreyi TaxID=667449 RepID=A0ACC2QK75_9NEOP|nr:hypothetical protein PYW08_005853 [Mythimna loreyi]
MILLPLWVLLWKYVKTRLVRYCHTFWETFGGVSVFVILFLVHLIDIFKLHPHVDSQRKDFDASSRRMAGNVPTIRVFYSPFNDFTQELMARVEAHLNKGPGFLSKHRWVFESINYPIQYHYDFIQKSDGLAEVRFKDDLSVGTDLKYSLYAVTDEVENDLNGLFGGLLRTVTPKEEIAPPFLPQLQWAIDKSYMELLSNEPINQAIQMSDIPNFVKGELLTLHRFMIVCTIMGPLPFFLVHSSRLIIERKTGMRELMKHSGIYSNVLRFSHVLEALLAGVLYSSAVTILLKITWQPLLPESDALIILFTLIWHFVNTMCFAFITTVLSQDSQHAVCLGLVLYLSTFILDFLWHSYKQYTFILCCILPHAPIYLFWDEVVYLERLGVGTQFTNIYISHSDVYSVAVVWCFLGVQLLVTLTISWYLDLTRPGFYGVPKRWNFFCKPKYWHSNIKRRIIRLPSFLVKRDGIHFESKPKKAEIAVQILNVSKLMVFKQHGSRTSQVIALDSVSFDCYKGEVTMLLGGNGAGKTTLMLIVAGMFTATEGAVFVEGLDVANREKEIRHNVGLCMQDTVCHRFLTVKENIMFFKKLQGRPAKGFTVLQLLKSLKLSKVADHYGSQLSKGHLRCLQVACVLAADADVLVLDEPTTAMDLDMRHHLWDVLAVLRGNKTILMTTTCLEEANMLGDRIAILDKGVLKCHGSPPFLKNIIGTSFTLAITIKDGSRLVELKEMVDTIIPELECRIHEMRRIDFLLPTKEFARFPELFEALEEHQNHFGIILIDVAMFMEEVFSKYIESGDVEPYEIKKHRSHLRKEHAAGCYLVLNQICLLIKRMFIYTMKTKGFFFLLRTGVPIICFLIITVTSNYALRHHKLFSPQVAPVQRTGDTRLVYNVAPFRRRGLFDTVRSYQDVNPVYSRDIDKEFRRLSKGYNQDTLGFKITDNYTKIYHSKDPLSTSKSVNLFSNVYMSMYMPHLNNTIQTTYETLPKPLSNKLREVKSKFLSLKWSCWITFLSILPTTPTIIICIVERRCGIRDNHIMAGCSPKIHWGAKLLVHMFVFTFMIMVPIIFIAYSLDYDSTFIFWPFSLAVAVLLFTFGLAFHSYLYVLSYILEENYAISEIYIVSLLFGVILPMFVSILETLWQKSVYFAIPYFTLMIVGRTTPQFALGFGLARLVLRARLNAFCVLNRMRCPDLEFEEKAFDVNVCCRSKSYAPFPYLISYETGLVDLINLMLQFVVFSTLVILLEYRIPQYFYEQFMFSGYKEPPQTFTFHNVKQETSFVRTALRERKYDGKVLLVKNIHKDYKTAKVVVKKKQIEKLNVVRGVSFATKLGECLAIIGPQSAGKTSLLKMLAGTKVMTRGDACINGIYIRRNRMACHYSISKLESKCDKLSR